MNETDDARRDELVRRLSTLAQRFADEHGTRLRVVADGPDVYIRGIESLPEADQLTLVCQSQEAYLEVMLGPEK